jgi:hypothetical protein
MQKLGGMVSIPLPVPSGPCTPLCARPQKGRRSGHSHRAAVERIVVDHPSSHVAPAEQPLNSSDAIDSLHQISDTTWTQASVAKPLGMAEGMATGGVGQSHCRHGLLHRSLLKGGIDVLAP